MEDQACFTVLEEATWEQGGMGWEVGDCLLRLAGSVCRVRLAM